MVKLLYRLIYIIPLTLFGAGIILSYVFNEPLTGRQFFLVAIFAMFLPILSRLNTHMKIIVSGGVLIVVAAVVFAAIRLDESSDHPAIYNQVIVILTALALSAVCFIALKSNVIKYLVSIGIIVFLAVSMVLRYYVTRLEVWCCLAFVLSFAAEEIQRIYRKRESFEKERYVTFLWPFILALSLLASLIKAPAKPYDWDLFVKIYERTKEITIELREKLFYSHSEDYNSSMIGFSGDARIGGSVGGRSESIMSIATSNRLDDTIYLTGNVFSDFNGREWTSGRSFGAKERVLDALTAMCYAQKYGQSRAHDYARSDSINITYLPFSSKYVFAPSKLLEIDVDDKIFTPEERDGGIFFDRTKIVNATYKVVYVRVNYNPAAVNMVTSGELEPEENDWFKTLRSYGATGDEDISFEKKQEYEAFVKKQYSGGVKVSPGIAESINKITEAGATDFERLKVLEATLGSMTYTDSPGALPSKVNDAGSYLDYFLTESQEGYCVHYATAFCLIARAMGYPSRYVQGYAVTMNGTGLATVDSSMAHAWPEVWLDGIGWMRFEPTPGRAVATGSWRTTFERVPEGESLNLKEGLNPDYKPDGEADFFGPVEDKEEDGPKLEWYVFVIPIAAFILFAAVLLLVESLRVRLRFKKAAPEEKAYILCCRNLRMLGFCGYRRKQGETLHEFGKRIDGEETAEALSFIPCFERVLYSNRSVDDDSVKTIEICENNLKNLLKNKKKLLYFIYRFRSIHGKNIP